MLHALRNFLFIAGGRHICKRNHEKRPNQAACLNLVVNAVTVRNTVYLQAALEQLRSEGCEIGEDERKSAADGRRLIGKIN